MRVQTVETTATLEARQRRLAELIEGFTGVDGVYSTSIGELDLVRASTRTEPFVAIQEPSLCIVAQGAKQVLLGDSVYSYSPSHYLLVSLDLPLTGQIVEATAANPYLALRLGFDSASIGEMLTDARPALGVPISHALPQEGERGESARVQRLGSALAVSPATPTLLDAVIRLMQLLEHPEDAPVLAPLIRREILYRLLTGEQGQRLRQIAIVSSGTHRIARAIDWLKHNYTRPLRVEDMARVAHMSPSGFHHCFKEVTALTPLQYQKQLRLQEARRLLFSEDMDAATASNRVGYASPSQFSREYSRHFGTSPQRDRARLRVSR